MILPTYFYHLPDCLTKQFFTTQKAYCVKKELGVNISNAAQNYFSIAIIPEDLPHDKVVLGYYSTIRYIYRHENGYLFTVVLMFLVGVWFAITSYILRRGTLFFGLGGGFGWAVDEGAAIFSGG